MALVVCQLRFEEHEQELQSAIGRQFLQELAADYPIPARVRSQEVTIDVNPVREDVAKTQRQGWRASTVDNKWAVTLLPNAVNLETTAFTTFADFSQRLSRALEVTRDLIQPVLTERLGLRFVNLLPTPHSTTKVADLPTGTSLFIEPMRGPAATPQLAAGVIGFEGRCLFDAGDGLRVNLRWGLGSGDQTPIDIDVFRDSQSVFNLDSALAEATRCNAVASSLFQSILSKSALSRLRSGKNR
ncbi:MAG: TIGR04255 family protein [Candidatus Dormibacteria bacterium]